MRRRVSSLGKAGLTRIETIPRSFRSRPSYGRTTRIWLVASGYSAGRWSRARLYFSRSLALRVRHSRIIDICARQSPVVSATRRPLTVDHRMREWYIGPSRRVGAHSPFAVLRQCLTGRVASLSLWKERLESGPESPLTRPRSRPFQSPVTMCPISKSRSIRLRMPCRPSRRLWKALMSSRCMACRPCLWGLCRLFLLHPFRLISLARPNQPCVHTPALTRFEY